MPQNVQEMLGEAFRNHQGGKTSEAEKLYREILSLDPDHADSLHLLGLLTYQGGDHEAGAALISRAIRVKNDVASYHYNLGSIYQGQGKPAEAEACYVRAIAIRPGYAEAHNNLGLLLAGRGENAEAAACYERAIAVRPDHAEAHCNLGVALKKLGRTKEAEEYFRRCLALDPSDPYGAGLYLAAAGAAKMPGRTPEAQIQKLYAHRARFWDKGATAAQPYRAHELVAGAFVRLWQGAQKPDILDAGCGTGLTGLVLRARARRLDGVDLSPAMLEKARALNVYDELHQGDLVAFMDGAPEKYDAVACAATLIHFGDLHPPLRAAAASLRKGGLFICTLFPAADEKGIDPAAFPGCFAHGREYARKAAADCGFVVELLEDDVHEYSGGKPVMGLVAGFRK